MCKHGRLSHVRRWPGGMLLLRLLRWLLLKLLPHAARSRLRLWQEPSGTTLRRASHGIPAHELHGVPRSHVGRQEPSPRGAKPKRGTVPQVPTTNRAGGSRPHGPNSLLQRVDTTTTCWLAHPWDGSRARAPGLAHLPAWLTGGPIVRAIAAGRAVAPRAPARGGTQAGDGGSAAGGVSEPHALLHQATLGGPSRRLCRAVEGVQEGVAGFGTPQLAVLACLGREGGVGRVACKQGDAIRKVGPHVSTWSGTVHSEVL